jgi:hypothetical protein
MEEVLGNEFTWWMGVVEDRDDPLKLGRCRVRIYHWYTDDTALLPTDKLPWAQPMCPITNGATQNIGETPLGIQVGTWVVGFFMDGKLAQKPMIMGTIAGIPGAEPDMNRLARNDPEFPPSNPDLKNIQRELGIFTSQGTFWNEPESPYATEYPHNKVTETERGHIFEVDDTPDHERIHEYHKSGTFYEIDQNGQKVTKVVNDNYEITLGDDYVYVDGSCNITVGGNANVRCLNADVLALNNVDVTAVQDITMLAGKSITMVAGTNIQLVAPRIDFN